MVFVYTDCGFPAPPHHHTHISSHVVSFLSLFAVVQMQLVTVEDVLTMMGDTSNLGEKGELEKLIEAVGRVFSTNDGSDYIPYPTGYSGEVNKVRTRAFWFLGSNGFIARDVT